MLWRGVDMHQILQDFRYAARMLGKNAGLTAVIVLSLAIGIGANTAIFSVVDALLLRPLPYPEPDRLAVLWLRSPGINIPQDWPSPGQYIDMQKENRSFSEMSISVGRGGTLLGIDQPQSVDILRTSSSLFHLLGARPLMGRLLLPEEDVPGRPRGCHPELPDLAAALQLRSADRRQDHPPNRQRHGHMTRTSSRWPACSAGVPAQ